MHDAPRMAVPTLAAGPVPALVRPAPGCLGRSTPMAESARECAAHREPPADGTSCDEPGAVRALLQAASARGWRSGERRAVEADGRPLLEASAAARAGAPVPRARGG